MRAFLLRNNMITKIDDQSSVNKIKKSFKESKFFNGTKFEYGQQMISHRTKLIDSNVGCDLYYSLTSLKIDTIIKHFNFEKHSFGFQTYRRYKHYLLKSNDVHYSISYNNERGVDIYVCEADIEKCENPEEVYYNFFKELMQIQNPTVDINLYYPSYENLKG